MQMPRCANSLPAKASNGKSEPAGSAAYPDGAPRLGDAARTDTYRLAHVGRARAAIQRFEYSTEACWKAAQSTLSLHFGLELASPKSVIRASAQNGLLTEAAARQAMDLVDDRNLTSHTTNEALAQAIWSRLPAHLSVLQQWVTALERQNDKTL